MNSIERVIEKFFWEADNRPINPLTNFLFWGFTIPSFFVDGIYNWARNLYIYLANEEIHEDTTAVPWTVYQPGLQDFIYGGRDKGKKSKHF